MILTQLITQSSSDPGTNAKAIFTKGWTIFKQCLQCTKHKQAFLQHQACMLSRSNEFVHVQMYSLWTMQGKCHSLFISQFLFVLFTVSWGSDAEQNLTLNSCYFPPHLLLKLSQSQSCAELKGNLQQIFFFFFWDTEIGLSPSTSQQRRSKSCLLLRHSEYIMVLAVEDVVVAAFWAA